MWSCICDLLVIYEKWGVYTSLAGVIRKRNSFSSLNWRSSMGSIDLGNELSNTHRYCRDFYCIADWTFSFVIVGVHQPLVGILRRPNSREGAATKQQCTRKHSHGNYPGARQQFHGNHSQQPMASGPSSHHSNNSSRNPYQSGHQKKNNSHMVDVHQRHKHLNSQNIDPPSYTQMYPRTSSRLTDNSQRHLDDSGYYGHHGHGGQKGSMPSSDGYNSNKSRASATTDSCDMYTDNASSTSGSYVLDGKDLQEVNELSSPVVV